MNNPPKVLSSEEQEDALTSINLAYQDLSDKQKKTEDKLKSVDPNKAQQFERLGMGFGSYGGNARSSHISHSAVTDMKLIEQSNPVVSSNQSRDLAGDPFSTNKYKDFVKQSDDDFWNDNGVFSKKPSKKPDTIDSIATIDLDRKYVTTYFESSFFTNSLIVSHSKRTGSNSGGIKPNTGSSNTQVAQQKFSNAKSISSDQYFNKDVSNVSLLITVMFLFNCYDFRVTTIKVHDASKGPEVLVLTITSTGAPVCPLTTHLMDQISIRPTCTISKKMSRIV